MSKYASKVISCQDVKSIGVTLRINKPALIDYFLLIKKSFHKHNINIFLEEKSAIMVQNSDMFKKDYLKDVHIVSLVDMCEKSDILICCGGDGTLLNLVRSSHSYQKPIFGIRGGNLSFLLNAKIQDLDIFVQRIFTQNLQVNEHMMLEVNPKKKNELTNVHVFNDIVFKNKDIFKITNLNLFINDELVNSYRGDGLIVSTPTGSTAYNLSAQGPIVHPINKAIIITPISPHGLTQNPIVLPHHFEISIQSPNGDVFVVLDGHSCIEMKENEKLNISISKYSVDMIHLSNNQYIKSLKEKLSWGV